MDRSMSTGLQYPLLLTSCIDPNGMPGTSRPDPFIREQDYVTALQTHIAADVFDKIVFIDNSGWDLAAFEVIRQQTPRLKMELISVQQNDYPRERGKSYGEQWMVDTAVEKSSLIESSGGFVKLTGRLRVLNLDRMIRRVPSDIDLLIDMRDHDFFKYVGKSHWCSHHADTRLYACSKKFYSKNLQGRYSDLNESTGRFVENLFFDVCKANLRNPEFRVRGRLPVEPLFSGLAGHWNKEYGASSDRWKQRTRAFCRRFAPWIWI